MSAIRKTRSNAYRFARELGNAEAVGKSITSGSPTPILKRVIRRAAYRNTNRGLSKVLRAFGI